jgi:hypothetical protein
MWPLSGDLVDLHRGVLLAVALFSAKPFAALVFENENFFGFILGHDMALDRGIRHMGVAQGDLIAIGNHQHSVKGYLATDLAGEFFNFYDVPFPDLVLFSA